MGFSFQYLLYLRNKFYKILGLFACFPLSTRTQVVGKGAIYRGQRRGEANPLLARVRINKLAIYFFLLLHTSSDCQVRLFSIQFSYVRVRLCQLSQFIVRILLRR